MIYGSELQIKMMTSSIRCSLSLSFPVRGGACHGPDRLQEGPHASRISWKATQFQLIRPILLASVQAYTILGSL